VSAEESSVKTEPEAPLDRSRLVLVGMLPPPVTGQSLGFELIVRGAGERGLEHDVINLAGSGGDWGGRPTVGRAFEYLFILLEYARRVTGGRKVVYLMISQTLAGFARDLAMIWYAKVWGHRIACQLRGGNYDAFYAGQPRWIRRLIRKTLRMTDAILVLGEEIRREFDFEPALRDRIVVVPNGLPMSVDGPVRAKQLPRTEHEPIELLFLSNLIESKGWLETIEAVSLLVKDHGLNIVCRFRGRFLQNQADDVRVRSDEHAQRLFEERVSELGLEDVAVFEGPVSGQAKVDALRRAHFFILPTRYIFEGQPISIIEAMAYGCVVVSTRYRAIPELVEDGRTGFLVPAGQPEAIAGAIAEGCRSPGRFEELSEEARRRFLERFTADRHLENLFSTVMDVNARRLGAPSS